MESAIYGLEGCTSTTIGSVQALLANVPGVTIHRNRRGVYILYVQSDSPVEEQLQELLRSIEIRLVAA